MSQGYRPEMANSPAIHLLHAHKQENKLHRELIAQTNIRLQEFIGILELVPHREGARTLSMDLFSLFERFCGFDLPDGFNIEFGRQITKACRDGKLPFVRKTFNRASLAGFKGLDVDLLIITLRKVSRPAA